MNPGNHAAADGQSHGEPEEGTGQFHVTHESGAEAESGLGFALLTPRPVLT